MQFPGQKHSDKLEHTCVMCGTLVPAHDTSWSHVCSVSSHPPTVTASFSYGPDDAFRFWDSICLDTGHGAFSNEVSIQSLCVSQPQAPHGEHAHGMVLHAQLHPLCQPELCLSLLNTFTETQGCTNMVTI